MKGTVTISLEKYNSIIDKTQELLKENQELKLALKNEDAVIVKTGPSIFEYIKVWGSSKLVKEFDGVITSLRKQVEQFEDVKQMNLWQFWKWKKTL